MTKRALVRALEGLAFLAELADDRRARGLQRAARAISDAEEDPGDLAVAGRLTELDGIGPKMAALVDALLAGRPAEMAQDLEARVPASLVELRRVKGLGAKKIRRLWQELDVTTVGELEQACRENRLVTLDGFGKGTQAKMLEGIDRLRENEGKLRRDEVRRLVEPVREAVPEAVVVGGARRGFELIDGPVEILIPEDATAGDEGVIPAPEGVRIRRIPRARLGWEALRGTASEAHLALLQARAAERGVDLDAADAPTEDAVYGALDLVPTPPERREPGVPLVPAGTAAPPLLRREDLRGAIHNHTTASDGSHSLAQMRAAATARGLAYLAITEHSESAFYARGLDAERLAEQAAAIAELNADGTGEAVLLRGVESDILEDGGLDYPDDVLAELELVVASVHRRFSQDRAAATARMVAAARHPRTTVVGHPTGRLLRGRDPNDFDMAALLDACAESGCAIELNGNPQRLDLSAEHLGMAKERGVLVSVAADAHAVHELDFLDYAVDVARRAGLGPDDVLNTRPLEDLRRWLAARRPPA